MERIPVKSSNLASVGYDAETQVLEVEFTSGQVYQYQDVPPEKHKALLKAESLGRYFGQNIRGAHKFAKIEPEPPVKEAKGAA
jgi:hypothetical protein